MVASASTAARVLVDASSRLMDMNGRITSTVTKCRPSPPSPFSAFDTDYTPFDRGHIIALEFTPDIGENN